MIKSIILARSGASVRHILSTCTQSLAEQV